MPGPVNQVLRQARVTTRCLCAGPRVSRRATPASDRSQRDRHFAKCRRNDGRSASSRSGRSRSRPKEFRAAGSPLSILCCAKEQVALMAKSSVATPTKRESNSCSRSSFGPKRIMAWNKPRASRLLVAGAVIARGAADRHATCRGRRRCRPSTVSDTSARKTSPSLNIGFRALGHRQLRIENRAAHFQMRIERFARNEEPHDFARAFEDRVDAAIAQETLDRDRLPRRARRAIAQFRNRGRRALASLHRRSSRSSPSPTFCTSRFRSADRPPCDRPAREVRKVIASIAKVLPAISAILPAIA